MRKAFVEEYYFALEDGDANNTESTCASSRDCQDDESMMTMCCVNIIMTSASTGETDQLQRCMAEQMVQASFEWTMSLDTDKQNEEMTVDMKCMDSSLASYLSRFGILFAALALLVSTSV
jgi:hypothetical protein